MLNLTRSLALFDPELFTQDVHIIGCGATGSRIAMQIAMLGVKNITLWDDDIVEEHNIPNQLFDWADIGKNKATALRQNIDFKSTYNPLSTITVHEEKVTNQPLTGVVFLLTDTMASRSEIWKNCIKMNFRIPLMIETRMDVDNFRIYSISPTNLEHTKYWEGTLCSDEEAVESACGGKLTIGATAETISGFSVWEFLKWHGSGIIGTELIMSLRPEPLIFLNSI